MVICITDGSKLSGQGGVQEEVHVMKYCCVIGISEANLKVDICAT